MRKADTPPGKMNLGAKPQCRRWFKKIVFVFCYRKVLSCEKHCKYRIFRPFGHLLNQCFLTLWRPDFLWRYKTIRADIKKHTIRGRKHSLLSPSWLPYKQGQTYLSTGGSLFISTVDECEWFCYLFTIRNVIEKFIYGYYNISIQSDNFEFIPARWKYVS